MVKFIDPHVDVTGLDRLPDAHVLGCTLYGEARGSGLYELTAVGEVIMNRVGDGRYGRGIRGVCLKRKAFSCWWEDSKNRTMTLRMARCLLNGQRFETLADGLTWKKIAALLPGIIDGAFLPPSVPDCLHYHTVPDSQPEAWPKWARGRQPEVIMGPFKFYENVDGPTPKR